MSNYKIIEGCRKNSKLYICDGFAYVRDKETKSGLCLKCRKHNKLCPGRSVIMNNTLRITRPHSCIANEDEIEVIKFKSQVKRNAEDSVYSLRAVFDSAAANCPVADQISYPEVENIMAKRRRSNLPRLPSTIQEAVQLIKENDRYKRSLKAEVFVNENVALIFAHEEMIKLVNENNILFCQFDATFSVVPTAKAIFPASHCDDSVP